MSYSEILKTLKKKEYRPIYFLHGDEAYYIDEITNFIEKKILSEAERSFNQTIFYGKEADHKTIIDTASRYPMMAPYQVVILKEAQDMRTLKELLPYVQRPVPTTILLICHKHKKFDARTKFAKALKEKAVVFESKKLYDNQVPEWIATYLKDRKLGIEAAARELVAEYLGTNLAKISNELDKLAINLPAGTTVNAQHIQDNIGISKDYNVFELQKALGQKDVLKANRIINYFIANPRKNPLVVIIGTLYNFFSKVYLAHFLKNVPDRELSKALKLRSDYFLRDYKLARRHYALPQAEQAIHILREYDLRSKGVNNDGTSEGALLKEMIYRILH
ncbi:MAG: DNA polymerase III subunit delta [Bacteroidota bacterium]